MKLHLEISDGCVPSTQHLHQSEPQPLHVVELLLLGRNLLLQHPHDALPLRAARAEPAAAHHHRPLHVILPSCPCHSMSRPPAAAPGSCSSLGWASFGWQVDSVRPGRHILRVNLLKSQMVPAKRCRGSLSMNKVVVMKRQAEGVAD